jgi:hypothetical protein
MRFRLTLTILGLTLWILFSCHAQLGDSGSPESFAKSFVDAINSKSTERRLELLHPKSKACINAETRPYFDWILVRQSRHVISAAYQVAIQPLSSQRKVSPDGRSAYPVRPTHQLQIDFDTGPNKNTSLVLFTVREGQRWYEVLPCPSSEAVTSARAAEASRAIQERRVRSLVEKLGEPLRSEIMLLAEKGQRIDAIKKYRDATGEDLTTAKDVVDLLVPR